MATKQKKKKQAKATQPAEAQQLGNVKPDWQYLLPALILALVVFGQTMGFDFVNWDDDVNILENRGVTTFDLKTIFTETVIGNYNPLPIFTFALEYAMVGTKAGLYHFNNLWLHLLNVALVYFLGRRLKLDQVPAAILACLFAIHPLRVESVAWVTERKDVLFSVFYFGALLVYEKHRQSGSKSSWHWGVAGLFILALFSKIQAVSLPLSMICLDYLRNDKFKLGAPFNFNTHEVLAKAPYFLMSLAVGLLGVFFLGRDGSLADATNYSAIDRLAVGAYAYTVYLVKAVIPYEMSPLYPYPSTLPTQAYLSFGIVIAAIAAMIYGFLQKWKGITFTLAFFTVNVMFMLQVLGAGQGYLADRFTYVGYFGLFWGMAFLYQRLSANQGIRRGLQIGVGVFLLVLTLVAFKQTRIWQNGGTLWTHVGKVYPRAGTAHGNLAMYLRDEGETDLAMGLYRKAISVDPNEGSYHNSLGKLHFDNGRTAEALAEYSAGIEVEPDLGELYINRGAAYAKTGQYPQSEVDLNKGVEMEPDNFNAYLNRSLLYYTIGRTQEALVDYDVMLRMRPERHDLLQERGALKASIGNVVGGKADVQQAIRMAGRSPEAARYQEILNQM
ncbi:MAG: tetratricopeptide repeat protein [Saprospiraceae bacterium]